MRSLFAALQFLTVIPVPSRFAGHSAQVLHRSVVFFPVVGVLLGLGLSALDGVLLRLFPVAVASVLTVAAMLVVSGGLHLDGLSDTADGFCSGRPRSRMLEIMKDSRCGPMGVAAVVVVFALKIAALGAVTAESRRAVVLMMPLAGRCAIVIAMATLGYARPEGGTGAAFAASRPRRSALFAGGVLACVAWLACRWLGVAVAGAALIATAIMVAVSFRKIGGWTGDTLGATCEVVEIVPALVAACWLREAT